MNLPLPDFIESGSILTFRISRCPDLLLASEFDDVRKFGL